MSDAAAPPGKNADLPTRFATSLVLVAVAGLAVYLSGWPFRILAVAAAAVMLLEWAGMHRVPRHWTLLGVAALGIGLVIASQLPFPAAANNDFEINYDLLAPAPQGFAIIAAIGLVMGLISRRVALGWGIIYIGLPSYALIVVNWAWLQLSVWCLLVVAATDIFAYFAGRTIGGPKLAPRISPNKTWAGLFGGMVGAGLLGAFAAQYLGLPDAFIFVGALFGLLAQAGDLYESGVKRKLGVKDSGTLLPGHGGVLDRLDGLLPVALASFLLLIAIL